MSFYDWYKSYVDSTDRFVHDLVVAGEVDCHRLVPRGNNWKFDLEIPEDFDEDCAARVFYVNQFLKRTNFRTFIRDYVDKRNISRVPVGLSVIEPLRTPPDFHSRAARQLKALFEDEDSNPTYLATLRGREGNDGKMSNSRTFLFYGKNPTVRFMDVVEFLHANYAHLAHFVMIYGLQYMRLVGGSAQDLEACSLTFIRYRKNSGIAPHIDGVKDFGYSFGPIFTMAMGGDNKYLDLLPTLAETPECHPVRVCTRQFQTILMQGPARVEYTHGVPFGNIDEHMTMAFKFASIRTNKRVTEYTNEKLKSNFYNIAVE